MVRREEPEAAKAEEGSSCAFAAGESPEPVSIGAPGSRPRTMGRDPDVQAGRQKSVKRREPYSGEQARGPQHKVKPAASTDEQSEGRAAHVTAKATPDAGAPNRVDGLGGVLGAARVQGKEWNTGDPSEQLELRQGGSYKPKAKSSTAQRKSEGFVVPLMPVTNNAGGGKGSCFGHAQDGGKCEGMAAKSGPNDPKALLCFEEVRQPQSELWIGVECLSNGTYAPSRRPSVSRVREIRKHGLKGGLALTDPLIFPAD